MAATSKAKKYRNSLNLLDPTEVINKIDKPIDLTDKWPPQLRIQIRSNAHMQTGGFSTHNHIDINKAHK